MFLSLEQFVKI